VEIHALFDGLAWLTAAVTAVLLRRAFGDAYGDRAARPAPAYLGSIIVGAALGAYGLGSLNIWLAGQAGVARSIEGALAGAIVAVEVYKLANGIRGRTAALYALPVALGIAVGRIGCFLAGLDDFTYGTPTTLPWGHDFGDGILRHPVQLYETAAMLVFAIAYGIALVGRKKWVIDNGFSLLVLWYGTERFALEVLKPYPKLVAGLTVFQVVCLGMVIYALILLRPKRLPDARHA
jgi:prolipoprotein diacylglyceryltransferase